MTGDLYLTEYQKKIKVILKELDNNWLMVIVGILVVLVAGVNYLSKIFFIISIIVLLIMKFISTDLSDFDGTQIKSKFPKVKHILLYIFLVFLILGLTSIIAGPIVKSLNCISTSN